MAKSKSTKGTRKFSRDLRKSLEEALAWRQGKLELRTSVIEIPDPPAEYTTGTDQKNP